MRKTIRFGLLLSEPEQIAAKQLAELEGGLSQAALIRRLIREAAQRRNIWSSEHTISHTYRPKEVRQV